MRLANAVTLGGVAIGALSFAWGQFSSAGWVGVALTVLWTVASVMVVFGIGYYLLIFAASRRWLVPIGVMPKWHPPPVEEIESSVRVAERVIAEQFAPRAEVDLRAAGNLPSEPWLRWFHIIAVTTTDVIAGGARVSVLHRRYGAVSESWRWQGGSEIAEIRRVGVRIPLIVGALRDPNVPTSVGWWITRGNWYLTPLAHLTLGRHVTYFAPSARNVFDVTVSWDEDGQERAELAAFELRFWREMASEPRFIRVGDRPTVDDQIGGLTELRDAGVALRNEGMILGPVGNVTHWIGRVRQWAEETRDLISEVSTRDANFFYTLNTFMPAGFDDVAVQSPEHLLNLRCLHEQIQRLQTFMRTGAL